MPPRRSRGVKRVGSVRSVRRRDDEEEAATRKAGASWLALTTRLHGQETVCARARALQLDVIDSNASDRDKRISTKVTGGDGDVSVGCGIVVVLKKSGHMPSRIILGTAESMAAAGGLVDVASGCRRCHEDSRRAEQQQQKEKEEVNNG